jgi:hypothetical protein
MAKLIRNEGTHFTFEGTLGRVYRIRFGERIEPRSPTARGANGTERWGMLVDVRDNGTGKPQARWQKPKQWIQLDSLEKDYNLRDFAVEGEARVVPRPMRSGLVSLPSALENVAPPSAAEEHPVVIEPPTDAALMLFRGTTIGMRGQPGAEQICMTDLHRAFPGKKGPSDWMKQEGPREFLAHLQETLPGGSLESQAKLTEVEPGNPRLGTSHRTWGHWQVGFAYAKYLSHDLHAWVNQAAREKMTGPVASPVLARDEKLDLLLAALTEGHLESRRAIERKADLADVEAVVELISEVGPKAEARAREAAREEVAAAFAEREADIGRDVVTRANAMPRGGAQPIGKTVRDLLEAVGLPTERKPGKPLFLFGEVVIQAVARVPGAGGPVAKGSFSLPPSLVPATLNLLRMARAEFDRWGWSTSPTGHAIAGSRYTPAGLVRRMIDAMRKAPASQLPLAASGEWAA